MATRRARDRAPSPFPPAAARAAAARPSALPRPAFAVLLAVGTAQAADAVTFLRLMLDHGPLAEANPLVAGLAAQGHLGGLMAAKAGLVLLVVLAVAGVAGRHPVAGAFVATVAVVAGFVGAWSNVLALLAMR